MNLTFVGGKIVNPADEKVISKGVVVVEGNKIADVGSEGEVDVPKNSKIIDVKGCTIMPGLIDAHAHFTGFRSGDYINCLHRSAFSLREL